MLLRVVCTDDVRNVVVVRGELVTAVVRPRVIDLVTVVEQTHALLTDEEAAIVRCVYGARAECYMEDYLATSPRLSCPCFIPGPFRSAASDWSCPLHDEPAPRSVRRRERFYSLVLRTSAIESQSALGLHSGYRVSVVGLIVAVLMARGSLSLSLSLSPRLDLNG